MDVVISKLTANLISLSNSVINKSCHYCERCEVLLWGSTQGDIWDSAIKTQIPHAYLKISFDKWGIRGRAFTCCWGVLTSLQMYFTVKANWQSWLSKVVIVHYSLPLPKSHIWYSGKQHLTHPLMEPWRLSPIMFAPPKARMLCSCPLLWLTRWLWAMIAARAPRERLNELTVAVWRHFQIHWQHYYTKDFI